jgi:hypothetical protein
MGQPPQFLHLIPSLVPLSMAINGPQGCYPAISNRTYVNAVSDPPFERWESIAYCAQSRGTLYDFRKDTAATFADPEVFYPADEQSNEDPSQPIFTNITTSRNTTVSINMLTTKLSFGHPSSENEPVVKIPIGTINGTELGWLGLLGISPDSDISAMRAQLSGLKTTLLSNLKNSGYIPRLSWGYTAGAFASKLLPEYKISITNNSGDKTLGSLTLGGYDKLRFIPNNYTFDVLDVPGLSTIFAPEVVSINLEGAIVPLHDSTSGNNITVMSKDPLKKALFSLAMGGSPYLTLPKTSCNMIARAFNLSYDSNTSRYLISNELHQKLSNSKAALTFSFVDYQNPSDRPLTLRLEYPALHFFDGGPNGTNQRYMPIHPSTPNAMLEKNLKTAGISASYHALGRAFFQEVYVIADYEKRKFYMHQVDWTKPNNITQIVPLDDNPQFQVQRQSEESRRLPEKTIIIVAVVCSLALLIFIFLVSILCRKHRSRVISTEPPASIISTIPSKEMDAAIHLNASELNTPVGLHTTIPKNEGSLAELSTVRGAEMSGITQTQTLDSRPLFEMDGAMPSYEKAAKLGTPSSSHTKVPLHAITPASPIPKTPAEYYGRKKYTWQHKGEDDEGNMKAPQKGPQRNRQSI